MNAKVIIHRPNLTNEERAYRMEQIKRAVINFHREVHTNEKTRTNR
jgi:hypothetical protein